MQKKMTRIGAIFFAASLAQGCGMAVAPHDGMVLMGSPEAIRAYQDGMNGLVTNGKATADQDTAYWISRKAEEKEITTRKYAPGFFQKMFGIGKGGSN